MRLRVPVVWSRVDTTNPVPGYHAGPPPSNDIRLWVGAVKPRMLELIGRSAGGWVSPLNIYTPPDEVAPFAPPSSMLRPARLVAIRPRSAVCTTSLARLVRGAEARV